MRRTTEALSAILVSGGIPSHASPECPVRSMRAASWVTRSATRSARVRQSRSHRRLRGGDGEAETGTLATAWHSNKFLDPATDGAVLPILPLNGYKISNPTVLARITREELEQLLRGYGGRPTSSRVTSLRRCMKLWPRRSTPHRANQSHPAGRARQWEHRPPRWPIIVLNSPKAGPAQVRRMGYRWKAPSLAPGADLRPRYSSEHLKLLEDWLRSYRPEELFDEQGA